MRAEQIVESLLTGAAGVTALVGSRIYGGVAAQDVAAPLVVYRKVGATRDEGMDPADVQPDADTAFERAQIEVTCVAAEYEALKSLGEAVRLALAYRRGAVAGYELLGIFIESEGPDEFDPNRDEFFQAWVFRVEHSEP